MTLDVSKLRERRPATKQQLHTIRNGTRIVSRSEIEAKSGSVACATPLTGLESSEASKINKSRDPALANDKERVLANSQDPHTFKRKPFGGGWGQEEVTRHTMTLTQGYAMCHTFRKHSQVAKLAWKSCASIAVATTDWSSRKGRHSKPEG